MTAAPSLVPSPPQTLAHFGIGASEAAAAIGMSDYQRPIEKWLQKTGQAKGFEGNEKTRWGQVLEPVIRAHYVERNNVSVHVPPDSLFHRELPFVRATPDGIVLAADDSWSYVGPQVKNVGLRMAPKWDDGNGGHVAPMDYYVQAVVEMAVCALPRIDFAVLLGGQEYFEVTIERDLEVEAGVLEQLAVFWRCVEERRAPDFEDSDAHRAFLLRSIKQKVSVAASETDAASIARWREVVVDMRRLKDEEKSIKTALAATLAGADANRLTSELGDITVGAARKKTAWKSVSEVVPRLVSSLSAAERQIDEIRAMASAKGNQVIAAKLQELQQRLLIAVSAADYRALVAAATSLGVPGLNRPKDWTADDTDEES